MLFLYLKYKCIVFSSIPLYTYGIWKHRMIFIRKNSKKLQQKTACYSELFEKQ